MELQKEILIEAHDSGIEEETIKVRMLTDLHPRECVVRVASGGQLLPCFKARTLDIGGESVVQTNLAPDFKPEEYTGKIETIEKFVEQAQTAPVGPQVSPEESAKFMKAHEQDVAMEPSELPQMPAPQQEVQQAPALPLYGGAPPPTAGPPPNLDQIMQSGSSKNVNLNTTEGGQQ